MKNVRVWIAAFAIIFTSIFSVAPARAITNSDCVQTSTSLTVTAVANGSYCVISFTAGSGTWIVPVGAIDIDALVVGGGGGGAGGGSRAGNACNVISNGTRAGGGGGGGGGGQVRELKFYANSGQSISISVGAGGTGGAAGGCRLAGSPGGKGETTTIGSFYALGGGGGYGGTTLGEGGAGGSSYDSSGNIVSGGTIISAGDCSGTTTTGCTAAAGGASPLSSGRSPVDNGTATNGAIGSEGSSSTIYAGVFGSGGGGGNRHPLSPPGGTSRTGGNGGTNAGNGNSAGSGAAATANYGGGGGGGRGNGADAANSGSNAGDGGAGGSGLVVVRYVPTFSIVIPAPSINGQAYKGLSSTLSVTIPVAGIVRFFVNGKRIATCKDRVTSGAAPNNVATCIWKPSVQGASKITAQLSPSSNSYSSTLSTPLSVQVLFRATTR